MHFQEPVDQLVFAIAEIFGEFGDIGADNEAVLAAGDQKPPDVRVAPEERRRLAELVQRRPVELVDRVALTIEPQLHDSFVERDTLYRLTFERHGNLRFATA